LAHQLTFVSTGEEKPRGDFISANQQVFDRAMKVFGSAPAPSRSQFKARADSAKDPAIRG